MISNAREYDSNVFLLGLLIYREAASEPTDGKIAVAHTVLNRADNPKWWGDDPYSVIVKPKQYSSMTILGDPMTIRWPALTDLTFLKCLDIAERVMLRVLKNPCPGADSYYADTIPAPAWADPAKFVSKIGHHSFYNLDGDPAVETSKEA